jgi:hypothetical protein
MQVFRQHDPAMYPERVPRLYLFNGFPQFLNVSYQQVIAFPLQQVDGKKIGAARMPNSSIIHGFIVTPLPGLDTAHCPLVNAPYGLKKIFVSSKKLGKA